MPLEPSNAECVSGAWLDDVVSNLHIKGNIQDVNVFSRMNKAPIYELGP